MRSVHSASAVPGGWMRPAGPTPPGRVGGRGALGGRRRGVSGSGAPSPPPTPSSAVVRGVPVLGGEVDQPGDVRHLVPREIGGALPPDGVIDAVPPPVRRQ